MHSSTTGTSGPGLQIGVVGAGVAGLSAAIALRRAGHTVEVFERSKFRNEAGAAVSIPPNGARILRHWGYDPEKARGIPNIQVRRPNGATLENMGPPLFFKDVEERYGAPWNFYHRVDMHNCLKELAVDPNAPGTPAVIRLGAQVTDVDVEEGIITTIHGDSVQKDLVIVADGQHDRLNFKVTGQNVPMIRSGQTAYRCLIPMEAILADPETRPLFENQEPGFWAPALPQKGVMCVTYPCRNGEVMNCIVLTRKLGDVTTVDDEEAIEDWNFPASHDDLKKILEGFHPSVVACMLKTPEVKVYTQMKRNPISALHKGKTILIGDACHPMLLTHAQGVSSSIEDGAALEVLLQASSVPASASVTSAPSSELLARLRLFESLRLPRVSATQLLTDPVPPGPPALAGPKQDALVANIRKYYQGDLPPKDAMPHSKPICDFFFAYDVRKEAEKVLAASNHSAINHVADGVNGMSLNETKANAQQSNLVNGVLAQPAPSTVQERADHRTAPVITAIPATATMNANKVKDAVETIERPQETQAVDSQATQFRSRRRRLLPQWLLDRFSPSNKGRKKSPSKSFRFSGGEKEVLVKVKELKDDEEEAPLAATVA